MTRRQMQLDNLLVSPFPFIKTIFILEIILERNCKRKKIVNTDINIQSVRQNKPHKGPSITNSTDIFMDMDTTSNIVRDNFLDNFIFHDTYGDALLKILPAPNPQRLLNTTNSLKFPGCKEFHLSSKTSQSST